MIQHQKIISWHTLSWMPDCFSRPYAINADTAKYTLMTKIIPWNATITSNPATSKKTFLCNDSSAPRSPAFGIGIDDAVPEVASCTIPRTRILNNMHLSKKDFKLKWFFLGFNWILWRCVMMDKMVAKNSMLASWPKQDEVIPNAIGFIINGSPPCPKVIVIA